jgi:hypothetical protein
MATYLSHILTAEGVRSFEKTYQRGVEQFSRFSSYSSQKKFLRVGYKKWFMDEALKDV